MGTPLIFDGLWRCLCPSVDAAALSVLWTASARPARPTRRPAAAAPHTNRPQPNRGRASRRHLHGAAAAVRPLGAVSRPLGSGSHNNNSNSSNDTHFRHVVDLLVAHPPYTCELERAPTAAVYAALRHLQNTPGPRAVARIQAYARYLLDVRGEPPTPALYEALVRANVHTGGTAEAVRDVLRGGVEGTPSLYAAALAVLAVHPDYLLRNAVLQAMRARWLEPGAAAQQSVALGLLRDGQYERALDQLEAMAGGGATNEAAPKEGSQTPSTPVVPGWLYDIFTYVLAHKGFLDAALMIMNHRLLKEEDQRDDEERKTQQAVSSARKAWGAWGRRVASGQGPLKPPPPMAPMAPTLSPASVPSAGRGMSPNLWYFLLDMCARWGHYEGIVYVWRRAVVPGPPVQGAQGVQGAQRAQRAQGPRLVTPSDAMALDILNTAARHHDTALASEVLQLLAARGTKLGMPHFEAMIDCYAGAGAVDRALQALCIMADAGLVPDAGCTRGVYRALTRPDTPAALLEETVSATLGALHAQYGGVPIAAFNVVLEALLASAVRGADAALALYRRVRQLCPVTGPNRATFQLLLRGLADTDVGALAFVAAEMRALGFGVDTATQDRLVYAQARHGSLDAAMAVLAEMEEQATGPTGPWISRRTAAALVQRCADEQDARIWAVAEASRARGRPLDALLREIRARQPLGAERPRGGEQGKAGAEAQE